MRVRFSPDAPIIIEDTMKISKKQITKNHVEYSVNIKHRCGHVNPLITLYEVSKTDLKKIKGNYCPHCQLESLMSE